jgi:hypothetical protein
MKIAQLRVVGLGYRHSSAIRTHRFANPLVNPRHTYGNSTILFPAERYEQVKKLFDTLNKADNHTITLKQTGAAN